VAVAVVVRAIGIGVLPPRLLALLLREVGRSLLFVSERDQRLAREGPDRRAVEGHVLPDRLHEDVIAHGESSRRGRDGYAFGDGIRGLSHACNPLPRGYLPAAKPRGGENRSNESAEGRG